MVSPCRVCHAVPQKSGTLGAPPGTLLVDPRGTDSGSKRPGAHNDQQEIMNREENITRETGREARYPAGTLPQGDRLYWVREPGLRARAGPGLLHPVLTQLARGQTVTADTDVTLAADVPIRHGDHTAYIARELLAERYVRTAFEGAVAVAPELLVAAQGTPLAAYTRALMAMPSARAEPARYATTAGSWCTALNPGSGIASSGTPWGIHPSTGPRRCATSPPGAWARSWIGATPPLAVPMPRPSGTGCRPILPTNTRPWCTSAWPNPGLDTTGLPLQRRPSPMVAQFPERLAAGGEGRDAGSSNPVPAGTCRILGDEPGSPA